MGRNGTEQQLEPAPDAAVLSRLRRIDTALTTLCMQNAALEQRLAKVEDAIDRLRAAAEQRDAHLVEWIDPAIDVSGTLAQIREIGSTTIEAVDGLVAVLRRELAATRSAIDLAVGAAGVGELEGLEREIA
jgi:hypothetical protein